MTAAKVEITTTRPRVVVTNQRGISVTVSASGRPRVVIHPQGLRGASGAGAQRFQHVQPAPALEWTVNHNLGVIPAVTVLSPGSIEIDAEVIHATENQTLIRFNSPQAGLAVFN